MPLDSRDYEEIRQLFARYTQAADQHDAPGVADCFTSDGVFYLQAADIASDDQTFSGREGIERLINDAVYDATVVTQHWVSGGVRIDGDEDTATAQVYCMVLQITPGKPPSILVSGIYRDVLLRTAAGWRITQREFVPNP